MTCSTGNIILAAVVALIYGAQHCHTTVVDSCAQADLRQAEAEPARGAQLLQQRLGPAPAFIDSSAGDLREQARNQTQLPLSDEGRGALADERLPQLVSTDGIASLGRKFNHAIGQSALEADARSQGQAAIDALASDSAFESDFKNGDQSLRSYFQVHAQAGDADAYDPGEFADLNVKSYLKAFRAFGSHKTKKAEPGERTSAKSERSDEKAEVATSAKSERSDEKAKAQKAKTQKESNDEGKPKEKNASAFNMAALVWIPLVCGICGLVVVAGVLSTHLLTQDTEEPVEQGLVQTGADSRTAGIAGTWIEGHGFATPADLNKSLFATHSDPNKGEAENGEVDSTVPNGQGASESTSDPQDIGSVGNISEEEGSWIAPYCVSTNPQEGCERQQGQLEELRSVTPPPNAEADGASPSSPFQAIFASRSQHDDGSLPEDEDGSGPPASGESDAQASEKEADGDHGATNVQMLSSESLPATEAEESLPSSTSAESAQVEHQANVEPVAAGQSSGDEGVQEMEAGMSMPSTICPEPAEIEVKEQSEVDLENVTPPADPDDAEAEVKTRSEPDQDSIAPRVDPIDAEPDVEPDVDTNSEHELESGGHNEAVAETLGEERGELEQLKAEPPCADSNAITLDIKADSSEVDADGTLPPQSQLSSS